MTVRWPRHRRNDDAVSSIDHEQPMQIFESTLLLLVVAVGLAALARRWHAPYPALLAALGVALAFLPDTSSTRKRPGHLSGVSPEWV